MKFSTNEDIEAPISSVFDMLSSFEYYERAAMRRGAEVQRTDVLKAPGVGMTWATRFNMRGRAREVDLTMASYEPPNEMVLDVLSQGVKGETRFELMALSRSRTRIMISVELRPQTLPARLMLQSLKLTKSVLTKQYKARIGEYVKEMEERYQASAQT
ncbi:SRPBCC family protein [Roseobacter sp. YSTF-M11]|uniref:SRPBCC family protein n=1 Tax=Roseobacter insulae TaxID=2859783 RepID=A0A9X1JZG5_9RHOB|nr:SRPBCC family protein [Roseobacter insulae]MBW4709351.1 SRPBCC family protein [Roseobacter insulae]